MDSVINKPTLSSNHAAFLNPSIEQYCLILATKNSMKNVAGEQNVAILGRWETLMVTFNTNYKDTGLFSIYPIAKRAFAHVFCDWCV